MAEMEPIEAAMDGLLRRSLAAPVPSLSQDFEQRLMLEANRRSQPLGRFSRGLLAGYGVLSVLASTVVMRDQGLGWPVIGVSILVPLAMVVVVPALRSVKQTMVSPGKS